MQFWLADPNTNYGVILWTPDEDLDGYDMRFRSSEHTNKPKLEVIWSNQPKTVYFLKDHLGSVRATVDQTGAVVGYDDYDPWGYLLAGRTMASTVLPAATRNKFTGKERDDDYGVNWLHFPFRSYDPEIGRWLARDPWAHKYPSWSPYVYAMDNPMWFIDPDGRGVIINSSGRRLIVVGGTYKGEPILEKGIILEPGQMTDFRDPTGYDFYTIEGDENFTPVKVGDYYWAIVQPSGEARIIKPTGLMLAILNQAAKLRDSGVREVHESEKSFVSDLIEFFLKQQEKQEREKREKEKQEEERRKEEERKRAQEKRNEEHNGG